MTQVLSAVEGEIVYKEKSRKFYKKRRICRGEQTNIDYNENRIYIDKNLSFDEQPNKTFEKMAHAVRSIYLKDQ